MNKKKWRQKTKPILLNPNSPSKLTERTDEQRKEGKKNTEDV